MAEILSGSAGINFSITETDTATGTGTLSQTHLLDTAVRSLTLLPTDQAVSFTGYVGTTEATLNLLSLANVTATGALLQMVNGTQPIATAVAAKMIVVYNKHASNTLKVKVAAAGTSFLPTSEQITVPAGGAVAFSYGTVQTISTNGNIGLIGSGALTTCEVFIIVTTA